MGVMEKFRDSTKYILWILLISFGLLWGLSDTRVFDAMMAGPRSLGEVNGDPIQIEAYNQRVQYYIQQHNEQRGGNVSPEMRAYYEDQAWQDLVSNKLVQQKMEELGITVTDAELVEMITGENPDPFIRQQFQTEDGTIDRVALQTAIEAEENTQVWIMIEQQLRQKRRQQKLNNFIQSGLIVSDREVREDYINNNTSADIEYVRLPYSSIDEADVTVTDNEIQSYYNSNSDEFQRKESYEFSYVSFSKAPTQQDTARTINEMKELRDEFANAENDSTFLIRHQSATPYNSSYVSADDIKESLKPVLELEEGEVSTVINDNGQVHLVKLIDRKGNEVNFVDFSRNIIADPIATVDKQAEEAEDFLFFAEDDGFQQEAERRGLEVKSTTATKGQPFIPGIGQSRQILDFLEKQASEGELSEPIELNDRFVVLKINNIIPAGTRPLDEVRSQIENILTIQERENVALEKAQELMVSNQTLEAIASSMDQEVQKVDGVRKASSVLSGSGREPAVVGSIFGMEVGSISSPITGNNGAYIIKVLSINEADPANLTEAQKQQIKTRLSQTKAQRYLQTWVEQLKKDASIEDYRHLVFQS
mgnify:CR=1 FL=1